jgi:predicted amidohydrolase
MQRIRVASLQYLMRPVGRFEDFQNQVSALVETASDYKCRLMVFPEYFTVQLLTINDIRRPILEQVPALASQLPRFLEMMSALARKHEIYIVGGSIPVSDEESPDKVYNQSYLFSPTGRYDYQGKLHMTRWESEEWHITPRDSLRIFETDIGRIAITICYDVEFPEIARVAAREGVYLLVVPSCTDDRQGFLRVRYCAQARAIENQLYAIHACTVGSLPMVPAVSLNYGQASILTPSDFSFARDGILAEGVPNQESMVIGELNLDTIRESRTEGTVLPLRDSQRSAEVASKMELIEGL